MTRQRRPGWWLPMVYYYLATAIGLVIFLVGLIGGLRGLVTAALPEISSEVRNVYYEKRAPDGTLLTATPGEQEQVRADAVERARLGGYADALYGAVTALVGAPVFVWHLRQARRRDTDHPGDQPTDTPSPTGSAGSTGSTGSPAGPTQPGT